MSIRDNRRKVKQNVAVEVANLAAIAQHQEPVVNNEVPVRIQGETETRPELDTALSTGQLQAIALDVLNEIANTTQPETQTTETTQIEETEMNTTNETVQVEQPQIEVEQVATDLDLIKTWVLSQDINLEGFAKLNFHTLTGAALVEAIRLPAFVPTNISETLLSMMEQNPQTNKFHKLVKTITTANSTDEGINIAEVIDILLPMVKPVIVAKLNIAFTIVDAVKSFFTIPETPKVEEVKSTSVKVAPPKPEVAPVVEVTAPKNLNVNVSVTVTDKVDDKVLEPIVEVTPVVIKGPEELLAEWVAENPGYSFDAYYDKRNELYTEAAN